MRRARHVAETAALHAVIQKGEMRAGSVVNEAAVRIAPTISVASMPASMPSQATSPTTINTLPSAASGST